MRVESADQIRRIRVPADWLPESMRQPGAQVRLTFTLGERKVFRHRNKIKVSEWAERHRVVTAGPLEGGKWSNELAWYLVGMMDASFFPGVQTSVWCAAPQVGKSAAADTCLAYTMDRDPGPTLSVYPDRPLALKNSQDRLQPMIQRSPRLRGLMTGVDDDMSSMRIRLLNSVLYMGWAGSASSLSNDSIRYLKLDELDKWKETPNRREAGTEALAEKRTRTFSRSRKIWKISSPTVESGPIWQALTVEAQVIFEYRVRCPYCGGWQVMSFGERDSAGGIRWPADTRDPEAIHGRHLAWYQCEHCPAHWSDHDRDKAVRAGEWRAVDDGRELFAYLRAERPQKIGFHVPAWLSHFVSLSECAAAFLKGVSDKTALKDFMNSYKAEPWVDYTQERREANILALRDERPEGMVPGGGEVAALVAGVDTQDDGFYYEIRALGWGVTQESWQVRCGKVPSLDALEQVLFHNDYTDSAGTVYPVHLVVQDAMGHRTSEVYDFSRRWPGRVIPAKGAQRKHTPITWSRIDCYPGTTRQIPGGVSLLHIDTTYFKSTLAGKLEISGSDPGAWHLHSGATEEYARQMCAEYVDDKGLWQCPKGRANHYWDCAANCLVAAHVLEVRFWKRPEQQPAQAKESGKTANPYTGGRAIFGG